MRRSALLLLLALLTAGAFQACGDPPPAPPAEPAPSETGPYTPEGALRRPAPAPRQRPNVVVVLLDTVRQDALRPDEPDGGDMPALAARARRSVWFSQASSPASWTLPSLMSLFTGLMPQEHGVTGEDLLAPHLGALTTWAEVLGRAYGYETAAFAGTDWAGAEKALLQGFRVVRGGFLLQGADEHLDAWLAQRDASKPFFLFLHTFEAHDPYGAANHPYPPGPPAGLAEARAELLGLGASPPTAELVRRSVLRSADRHLLRSDPRLRAFQPEMTRFLWDGLRTQPGGTLAADLEQAYRAGVRWVDGLLERTLAGLEARGLLKDTLLIVTSDHGEAFGEHGMLLHGRQLYDELVRVPLVVSGPPPFDAPRRVDASVGLTDLLPTVLDLLGAPALPGVEGASLLPLLQAGGPGRPVRAEEVRTFFHTAGASIALVGSVRDARWKVVLTFERKDGTMREEAYDLVADPREQHDLLAAGASLDGLGLTPAFCAALEKARDRIWSVAASVAWRGAQGGPYDSAPAVLERRPAPCRGKP